MKHELSDIDPQKMDSQKWDMLLDLLKHPEKYSETQKDELLGDEEVNELYQQLVETRQSLDFAKSKEKMKMPSIDAEWEKLQDEMKLKEEKQQKEEISQNAETQQTAKLFPLWSPMRKVAAVAAVLVVSGITFAAIHLVTRRLVRAKAHFNLRHLRDSVRQCAELLNLRLTADWVPEHGVKPVLLLLNNAETLGRRAVAELGDVLRLDHKVKVLTRCDDLGKLLIIGLCVALRAAANVLHVASARLAAVFVVAVGTEGQPHCLDVVEYLCRLNALRQIGRAHV